MEINTETSPSSEKPSHPEWTKNNSLTTPVDLDRQIPTSLQSSVPVLDEKQLSDAFSKLNITSFTDNFPQVERRYVDPPVELQRYGLISFVPARGSTPNEQGIYGFAKLRGNYQTPEEANERSEYLIRNVDSYHKIYHAYVGRPFPLTLSSEFSQKVARVDLQRQTANAVSDEVKRQREKEAKEMKELEEREQELLADVSKEEVDPEDRYTELRVKKAQLVWTYAETEKKRGQMKESIIKARTEIEELDRSNPELKELYFKKYMDAREKAGLSTEQHADNFIKFMVEDIDLGF